MTTLQQVVTEELTKMMARQVDYTPAAEDLPYTIGVMVDDLKRSGLTEEDAPRVQAAFGNIAINVGRWPTTYMVREHLPGRKPAYKELSAPTSDSIIQRLKKLGLEQKALENPAEYAKRCRQWMMKNQSSLAVPSRIAAQFDEWPEEGQLSSKDP